MITVFMKMASNDIIHFQVKSLAIYDAQGVHLAAAESFQDKHNRVAILGNPIETKELEDIILSNGFPCKKLQDATAEFPNLAPDSKVFRTQ